MGVRGIGGRDLVGKIPVQVDLTRRENDVAATARAAPTSGRIAGSAARAGRAIRSAGVLAAFRRPPTSRRASPAGRGAGIRSAAIAVTGIDVWWAVLRATGDTETYDDHQRTSHQTPPETLE